MLVNAAAQAADGNQPGLPAGDGGTPAAKVQGDGNTAVPKTFTQEQLDRILADERKETERKAAEWKRKAKEFDELQNAKQQKELADLPELERLKAQLAELAPHKERATQYETAVGDILKARIEAIPPEKRRLVEALPESMSTLDKLKWIEAAGAELFGAVPQSLGAPQSGRVGSAASDPLMERAVQSVQRIKPWLRADSLEYKAAVARAYEELKAMNGSAQK